MAALSRRRFLGTGVTGILIASGLPAAGPPAALAHPSNPLFTLGVASGDPTHDSVELWTRLAPDPLHGGGMPPVPVPVRWEVATDPRLRRVVRRGTVLAWPQAAHTLHVRVEGLDPDRCYWYRFDAGDASPIGRTRTLPTPGSKVDRLRFAFVSCQHFEQGFYTAYEHLSQEDLDFVVHLGDCRNRHALYKSDPHLQAAHAMFPFIVTWDDHEVENNYAALVSEDNDIPGRAPVPQDVFRTRRAQRLSRVLRAHATRRIGAAPWRQCPALPDAALRRARQDPHGHAPVPLQPAVRRSAGSAAAAGRRHRLRLWGENDPHATLMGSEQEAWLRNDLRNSHAGWNVIAQQVMMARVNFAPTAPAPVLNMDAWDGVAAARNRLLGFVGDAGIDNFVVLTGDIHSSWVADLRANFDDPQAPVVATELVGTSISSSFPPEFTAAIQAALIHPDNAHVKFFDGLFRGYVRCDVTAERWLADFRAVDTVLAPVSSVRTLASFEVDEGHPGALPA